MVRVRFLIDPIDVQVPSLVKPNLTLRSLLRLILDVWPILMCSTKFKEELRPS